MPIGAELPLGRSFDAALAAEQQRLLYAGLPTSLVANLALGGILAVVQWSVVDHALVLGWCAALGLVVALRFLLLLAARRARPLEDAGRAMWLARFRRGALAAGLIWGAAGWWLFPVGDVVHQAFVSFVLAGIVAGAVTSLASDRISAMTFVLPALLPLIVRLLAEGGAVAVGMALMVTLFLVFTALSARRLYDNLHENVQLRLEASPREAALAESERRYRGLVESQTDVIVRVDPEGRYTFVNDVFCRIFGLSREQALGRSFLELVHAADAPRAFEMFQALWHPPHRLYHEFRCATAEGWRWYGFEGNAIRDENGAVTEVQASGRDITERKHTEDALRASEARLGFMLKTSPVVIYTCKAEPNFPATYVSPNIRELFGFDPAECLKNPRFWASGIHPEDAPRVFAGFEGMLDRDGHTHEYRFRMADGTYRWIHDSLRVVRAADGRPTEIIGYWADITERKRAEEALRESQTRLAAAAEIARLGYFRSSLRTGELEWSERLYEMLGYAPGEIQPSIEIFAASIAQEDRERVMGTIGQAYSATYAARPGERVALPTIEYRSRLRDGRELWLRTEAQAEVDESGRPVIVQGTVQDVTERKRVEDQLRAAHAKSRGILDAIPDLMLQLDDHGRFVDYHAYNAQDLAFPPDLFMGKTVAEVLPEPIAARTGEAMRKVAGTDAVEVFEYAMPTMQGAEQDWEARFASVATGGFLVIIRNISDRKKAERIKNEFISTVSHELRTPLTSIRGSLGLIAGGAVDGDPVRARELMLIAHKNAERLSFLINDILDMEKIASGKMRLALKPQPIMPLIEQALVVNRSYAEQYSVGFRLAIDSGGGMVNVDAERFQQVMANLLSNAAKFSPAGGTVEVAVAPCQMGVRVNVADQGPGIPEEFRPHIFEKFSQADASNARVRGGSGLGLAISKEIVERMAGRIGFECREGGGTTFFVELPRVAPARAVTV